MYSVIGQNMSVQHVQEDTGDESLHRHQIPRDLNTFFTGPIMGVCKTPTGYLRMADADGKMGIEKCG